MIPMVRSLLNKMQFFSTYIAGFATAAIIAIFAVPVWAQVAAAVTAESGSSSIWSTIIAGALTAMTGLGIYIVRKGKALLDKLFNALDRWLENKVENEFLEGALLRLSSLARMVSKDVFVSSYRDAKVAAKIALADKKITPEEYKNIGKAAKQSAMRQLKSITPKRIFDTVLGRDAGDGRVDALTSSLLEAAVHDLKIEGKIAKAAGGTTGGK